MWLFFFLGLCLRWLEVYNPVGLVAILCTEKDHTCLRRAHERSCSPAVSLFLAVPFFLEQLRTLIFSWQKKSVHFFLQLLPLSSFKYLIWRHQIILWAFLFPKQLANTMFYRYGNWRSKRLLTSPRSRISDVLLNNYISKAIMMWMYWKVANKTSTII